MESSDEDAPEISPCTAVLPDEQLGPEDLDCEGPYGAERTAGGVLVAQRTIPLPHGWRLDEAIEAPLSPDWHEPVVRWMLSERIADEDDHRSYLLRQAILVWNVYETAPWTLPTRKGTAYALLIIGLESHRFRPRSDALAANTFLNHPPADFFETLEELGGMNALHALLMEAFEHQHRA